MIGVTWGESPYLGADLRRVYGVGGVLVPVGSFSRRWRPPRTAREAGNPPTIASWPGADPAGRFGGTLLRSRSGRRGPGQVPPPRGALQSRRTSCGSCCASREVSRQSRVREVALRWCCRLAAYRARRGISALTTVPGCGPLAARLEPVGSAVHDVDGPPSCVRLVWSTSWCRDQSQTTRRGVLHRCGLPSVSRTSGTTSYSDRRHWTGPSPKLAPLQNGTRRGSSGLAASAFPDLAWPSPAGPHR